MSDVVLDNVDYTKPETVILNIIVTACCSVVSFKAWTTVVWAYNTVV